MLVGQEEDVHHYHAETTILAGRLVTPVEHEIKPQAYAKLAETGGYIPQRSHGYRIDSFLTLYTGYTQTAGHAATLPCTGSVTLATAVAEDLNILDVITADRVVAQTMTVHPKGHNTPITTFLGTRYENLRIAGWLIDIKLDLDILGAKPTNDASYLTNQDFLDRAALQHREVNRNSNLPAEIAARYNQVPVTVQTPSGKQETVECSLVDKAALDPKAPFRFFGHVIDIPHFGVLTLARVRHQVADYLTENNQTRQSTETQLTMLDLQLTCTNQGHFRCCDMILNGGGKKHPPPPPGPPPTS